MEKRTSEKRELKKWYTSFFSVLGQRQVESSDIVGCCFGTSSSDMYLYYMMLYRNFGLLKLCTYVITLCMEI